VIFRHAISQHWSKLNWAGHFLPAQYIDKFSGFLREGEVVDIQSSDAGNPDNGVFAT